MARHGPQGGDEGHPCQGGVTALVSGWALSCPRVGVCGGVVDHSAVAWVAEAGGAGCVGTRYACVDHDEPKITCIETYGNLSHRFGSEHAIRRWLRAWWGCAQMLAARYRNGAVARCLVEGIGDDCNAAVL